MEAVSRVNNLSHQPTPESAEVVAALQSRGSSSSGSREVHAPPAAASPGAALGAAPAGIAAAGAGPGGVGEAAPTAAQARGLLLPPPPGWAATAAAKAAKPGKAESMKWDPFQTADVQSRKRGGHRVGAGWGRARRRIMRMHGGRGVRGNWWFLLGPGSMGEAVRLACCSPAALPAPPCPPAVALALPLPWVCAWALPCSGGTEGAWHRAHIRGD